MVTSTDLHASSLAPSPHRSPASGPPPATEEAPIDAAAVYRAVFYTNTKKGELRVQLGVSLEDLVHGHQARFSYERMAVAEDGTVQPEKCQLQIDVLPGALPERVRQ
jgi:hypothetical protein